MFTTAKIYFVRENVSAQHGPFPMLAKSSARLTLRPFSQHCDDRGICGLGATKIAKNKNDHDLYIIIHNDHKGDYQFYKLVVVLSWLLFYFFSLYFSIM